MVRYDMTDRERDLQHAIDEAYYSNDGGEKLLQAIAAHTASSQMDDGHGQDDDDDDDGHDGDVRSASNNTTIYDTTNTTNNNTNHHIPNNHHNHNDHNLSSILSMARSVLTSIHDTYQRKLNAGEMLATAVTMTASDDCVLIDRAIEVRPVHPHLVIISIASKYYYQC